MHKLCINPCECLFLYAFTERVLLQNGPFSHIYNNDKPSTESQLCTRHSTKRVKECKKCQDQGILKAFTLQYKVYTLM